MWSTTQIGEFANMVKRDSVSIQILNQFNLEFFLFIAEYFLLHPHFAIQSA